MVTYGFPTVFPTVVHLHRDLGPPEAGCLVECGLRCGTRETTAYRGLDPERVTCATCKRIGKL